MSYTIERNTADGWRSDGLGEGDDGEMHLTYATSEEAASALRLLSKAHPYSSLRIAARGLPVSVAPPAASFAPLFSPEASR